MNNPELLIKLVKESDVILKRIIKRATKSADNYTEEDKENQAKDVLLFNTLSDMQISYVSNNKNSSK